MGGRQCEPFSLGLRTIVVALLAVSSSALKNSELVRETVRVEVGAAGDAVFAGAGKTYRLQLDNDKDALYKGDIEIGGQRFTGVFDTGSFDLVVMSSDCEKCRPTSKTSSELFDPSKSRTHRNGDYNRQFSYMSGSFSTREGYERVEIGPLHVKRQCIWEVMDANMPILEYEMFDTVIGMSGTSGTRQEKSLLQSLGVHYFSICFGKPSESPGYIVFNDRDPRNLPNVFAQVPLVGDRYWSADLNHVQLGNEGACTESCAGVIDSGTTFIGAPTEFIEKVAALIRSVDDACSNLAKLPPLKFKLSNEDYLLPPSAYVTRADSNLAPIPPSMEGYSCIPLMVPLTDVTEFGPLWILGMPFFRHYYTTFQVGSSDNADRAMYTAPASDACEAVTKKEATLLSAEQVALSVDLSRARLPLWLPNNGSKLVL